MIASKADMKKWVKTETKQERAGHPSHALLEVEYGELLIPSTYMNVELPGFVRLFDKGLVKGTINWMNDERLVWTMVE
jgi:hypothetical protein